MKQYELEQVSEPVNEKCKREGVFRVVWLDKNAEQGNIISLKDEEGYWVVNEVYEQIVNKCDIKRGWRVGGLT